MENEIMNIEGFDAMDDVVQAGGRSKMGTGVAMLIGAGVTLAVGAGAKLVKKLIAAKKAKKDQSQADYEDVD